MEHELNYDLCQDSAWVQKRNKRFVCVVLCNEETIEDFKDHLIEKDFIVTGDIEKIPNVAPWFIILQKDNTDLMVTRDKVFFDNWKFNNITRRMN